MEAEKGREVYRECMRNHAATLGTYAADGCGEFALDEARSGGLFCGACGCHRNFHRKVPAVDGATTGDSPAAAVYSPPLGGSAETEGRRRARTRFTAEQRARMGWFAEKMRWRIPKGEAAEEDEVGTFCREIGVTRQALKVWMHNHKGGASTPSAPVSPPLPPPPPPLPLPPAPTAADFDADTPSAGDDDGNADGSC